MNKINLDRPYILREDGRAGAKSFPIYQYKDEPGVYRRGNGEVAEDNYASAAGFDVAADRRLARMGEKKAEAMAGIEAEFEEKSAQIEKEVDEEIAAEDAAAKVKVDTPEKDPSTRDKVFAPGEVRTNSNNEPRETATRIMEHRGGGVWDVIDKKTGDTIKQGMDKDHAQIVLMDG